MLFDYATLKIIVWVFIGLLVISYAITAGTDLAIGILLPFLGKDNEQRCAIINIILSTWATNQIFLILVSTVLFFAWPIVYQVLFSCFYSVLLLFLVSLLLFSFSFSYRNTFVSQTWHYSWDKITCLSGFIVTLLFGLVVGNLLQGLSFYFKSDGSLIYSGNFLDLFNSFALLTGFLSVSMLLMHGAVSLQIKTASEIKKRAKKSVLIFTVFALGLFYWLVCWVALLEGYHITSRVFANEYENPLTTVVKRESGLWLDNYRHLPSLRWLPISAFVSGLLTALFSVMNKPRIAFIFSSMTLTIILLTAGSTLFPFIMPSKFSLKGSLTVWNASASPAMLHVLICIAVIILPSLITYKIVQKKEIFSI